jgi:excisionase family DNA binding protein
MRIRNASTLASAHTIRNSVETTKPDASVSPDVLTVPEVARDLRCSKAHVYNIIRNRVPGVKPLPTISLGRKKLVRRSSFEAWKRQNETHSFDATLAATSEINTVDA